MGLFYGTQPITAVYYGTQAITAIYKGTQLIWSPGGIRDAFETDGALDPARWTEDGGSGYPIAVENGLARVSMPDNVPLISSFTRRARYTGAQHAADGYVEFVIGNPGSGNLETDILRRASNTSGNAAGVGVRLRASGLYILRRVSSSDSEMVPCGAFQGGDLVRLTQNGNLHTMHRNGQFVGEWNDSGATALNTSSERTLTIVERGYKQLVGPRRFSPSIDSIECT